MQAASSALKNDEWITDEDIADPNPLPAIPGYPYPCTSSIS